MGLTKEEREFRIWYHRFLRDMKKAGLKVCDMPEEVANYALGLHIHALKIETKRRLAILEELEARTQ
jgi:hypothetical protein